MEKIKLIADTACDIPDGDLAAYHIDMPSVPITVDGKGYYERKSFSITGFYDVLDGASEIPTTSRVPIDDYLACYRKAYEEGYTAIISVTINAGGSSTNASAHMARDMLYAEVPQAKERLSIHVVDSRTYSAAYGYPVTQAAKMALEGASTGKILDYLDDFFCRVEVYLACYSLEYAKKSGRIGAAAAFVGDVLGMRPVILMVDGQTKTVDKVRGDKNIPARLVDIYKRVSPARDDPVIVIGGALEDPPLELASLLREETGQDPQVYRAGASIVINSGPKIVALVCLGKKRPRPQ